MLYYRVGRREKMGNKVVEVISGIFVLIAIFLFLNNSKATSSIVSTIASNSIRGIAVLQGKAGRVKV